MADTHKLTRYPKHAHTRNDATIEESKARKAAQLLIKWAAVVSSLSRLSLRTGVYKQSLYYNTGAPILDL